MFQVLFTCTLSLNTKNQSIKSEIRCTFCEISIEFYSTSTEAPFGQLIKRKVSKKLLLLITIFIIMKLHFGNLIANSYSDNTLPLNYSDRHRLRFHPNTRN
jgi:hypothetical protein